MGQVNYNTEDRKDKLKFHILPISMGIFQGMPKHVSHDKFTYQGSDEYSPAFPHLLEETLHKYFGLNL